MKKSAKCEINEMKKLTEQDEIQTINEINNIIQKQDEINKILSRRNSLN